MLGLSSVLWKLLGDHGAPSLLRAGDTHVYIFSS